MSTVVGAAPPTLLIVHTSRRRINWAAMSTSVLLSSDCINKSIASGTRFALEPRKRFWKLGEMKLDCRYPAPPVNSQ